ncbi:MAG: TusE/DsrC/DsvC family sulfur relay protein [Gammaproteobacteria bacterium]|nr:TusE/DsrC/DsvC family sulfur relay protein [Gammaproteobacteria bacterium]MBU1647253.1 TusE/DsrC/DsvC family sulfur relay protein [Gammaproteobacteria bacterium]MBU1972765.1 TusE/DsrC/DsvC family sulfur relay protein [Gammaproteobacteria bacterium]
MSLMINGVEKEVDADGFLVEADFSEEAVNDIAAAQGLTLTDDHRAVINYLREKYKEDGHTPNLRNLVKGLQDDGALPDASSNKLFDLFPDGGAAKQGVKIAGLPKPFGKGGY